MPRDRSSWAPRPIQSAALRSFIILAPIGVGLAVTWGLSVLIPRPAGPAAIGWWTGISLTALAALFVAERILRRLSPLAVLLKLSMAFPDRAPSRMRVAKKSGNLRRLKEELERARAEGTPTDLTRAAENILALAAALSAHDRRTRGHSERVRVFTDMLAAELRIPEAERGKLRWAALLHDIGKLRVPATILNKDADLAPHEWSLIHRHPEEGLTIAGPLIPWLGEAADAIRQHHERFDGTGYPAGLAGEEIARGARIVAVADAFETMTAGRPYQRPRSPEAARRELARGAGSQFDPEPVRALLNISITRLWWRAGMMSWISQLPLLGRIPRAAQQLEAALPSTGFAAGTAAALTAAALAAGPALHSATRPGTPAPARIATIAAASGTHTPPPAERSEKPAPKGAPSTGAGSRSAPGPAPVRTPQEPASPGPDAPPVRERPSPSPPPPPPGARPEPGLVERVVETLEDTVDDVARTIDDASG